MWTFLLFPLFVGYSLCQPQTQKLQQIQMNALTRNRRRFESWFSHGHATARFSCLDTCVLPEVMSPRAQRNGTSPPLPATFSPVFSTNVTCDEDEVKETVMTPYCIRKGLDKNVDVVDATSRYYIEINRYLTWHSALKFCRRRGMKLATFESFNRLRTFTAFLADTIPYKYVTETASLWSGGTNLGQKSNKAFIWTDSGNWVQRVIFDPSDKEKKGNCLYVTKLKLALEAKLVSGSCRITKQFACEAPTSCIGTVCRADETEDKDD